EEGLLFYDFLQNDQGYKRAFATREENLYDLVVMRAGIWSVGFEFFLRFSGFLQRWWKGKRDRRGMGKGRNFAEEERR
ncbi:MAG: hypothetical protein NZL93_02805, partial [Chthoniobacterales bacterium]|nr:hypothetical protein [Chthoniobacterales bacterium]